ncbi:hypothetical protein FRC00_002437 [Tulasnella sp. 408]|nr:hypothetical protein FRC00_002437 [Tulasnella sp. 408]
MAFPERDAKSDYEARSDSGIVSFSSSTDTTVKADTAAQGPSFRPDSYNSNPPPYNTPGPSSNSSPSSSTPSPRVNHLHLIKHSDSVNGSYTVDLDLVIPPQLLPSPVDGETLENLKLGSNSHVSADVVVVGQRKKRASLVAESKHGNVKINILSRDSCSFRLVVKKNGGLDLSDAVKQNYTPFSEDRQAAKGFIGDWSSSGYGDVVQAGTEWTGDELVATSKWRRVKVFYNDEVNATGAGFFSSWFKGFT